MDKTLCKTRIKELKKKNGLTQSKLAELIGVSDTAVANWERGASFPTGTRLSKLAEVFGVSEKYILGEISDSRPLLPVSGKEEPSIAFLQLLYATCPGLDILLEDGLSKEDIEVLTGPIKSLIRIHKLQRAEEARKEALEKIPFESRSLAAESNSVG